MNQLQKDPTQELIDVKTQLIIDLSRAIQDAASLGPAGDFTSIQETLKSKLPEADRRWQNAIDELEMQILDARAILSRDLERITARNAGSTARSAPAPAAAPLAPLKATPVPPPIIPSAAPTAPMAPMVMAPEAPMAPTVTPVPPPSVAGSVHGSSPLMMKKEPSSSGSTPRPAKASPALTKATLAKGASALTKSPVKKASPALTKAALAKTTGGINKSPKKSSPALSKSSPALSKASPALAKASPALSKASGKSSPALSKASPATAGKAAPVTNARGASVPSTTGPDTSGLANPTFAPVEQKQTPVPPPQIPPVMAAAAAVAATKPKQAPKKKSAGAVAAAAAATSAPSPASMSNSVSAVPPPQQLPATSSFSAPDMNKMTFAAVDGSEDIFISDAPHGAAAAAAPVSAPLNSTGLPAPANVHAHVAPPAQMGSAPPAPMAPSMAGAGRPAGGPVGPAPAPAPSPSMQQGMAPQAPMGMGPGGNNPAIPGAELLGLGGTDPGSSFEDMFMDPGDDDLQVHDMADFNDEFFVV